MPEQKKPTQPNTDESLLVSAAKVIGSAAGEVAALTGLAKPAPKTGEGAHPHSGRFPKKHKSRLPRRMKKMLAKKAAKAA